jgi:hypothetical protein
MKMSSFSLSRNFFLLFKLLVLTVFVFGLGLGIFSVICYFLCLLVCSSIATSCLRHWDVSTSWRLAFFSFSFLMNKIFHRTANTYLQHSSEKLEPNPNNPDYNNTSAHKEQANNKPCYYRSSCRHDTPKPYRLTTPELRKQKTTLQQLTEEASVQHQRTNKQIKSKNN